MGRFNDGNIITNEYCIGCNRCINVCPVMGANICIGDRDNLHIEVNNDKCIACGMCIKECSHNARVYRDDLSVVIDQLKKGNKLSIIVDPTFFYVMGDNAYRILGYFKAIGADVIYDGALGVEISMWAHAKYLKDNMMDNGLAPAFIAHTCPVVSNYGKIVNPDLLNYIIPIQLPSVCTAIYAHKYCKDQNDMVFFGPCVSMKDEFESIETGGHIRYNVTFRELNEYIEKLDLSRFYAKADVACKDLGRYVISTGLFSYLVAGLFHRRHVFSYVDRLDIGMLERYSTKNPRVRANHPLMLEMTATNIGCINGAGTGYSQFDFGDILTNRKEIYNRLGDYYPESKSSDEKYVDLSNYYKNLDFNDFLREFKDSYRQPFNIPLSVYENIFHKMYKDDFGKRNINCGSCGYSTCTEMVEAIANGYSKMNNCIHYMKDELENQIYVDTLTKLNSRKGFIRDCTSVFNANTNKADCKYILGTININKLRVVNDLYGVEIGDELIKAIGRTIRDHIGNYGTVGYLGAGSYVFMCEDGKVNNDALFEEYFDFKSIGIDFPISIRAGIYPIPDIERCDLNLAIDLSLAAMSKLNDRTKVSVRYFDESIMEEMNRDTSVTSNMRQAMDNNEFVLYFQPQFSHKSKKITGAEVLCRWVTGDGSMVSPGVFIPVFEKNGFINTLDRYVWREAFKTMYNWIKEGRTIVPISVNISRISMSKENIVDDINELYKEFPFDKNLIHFEITESAYAENQELIIQRVKAIKEMGFAIAMDDFGTGYSSLNALKDVPLDILKFDMGFIGKSTNREKGFRILEHMVSMANSMNLDTIAEGVEETEEADFFGKVGCDIIQGYLYAKPMPKEEFEKLLDEQQ